MICKLNRLCQVYRIPGVVKFYQERVFHFMIVIRMCMYAILLVVVINCLSTINMVYFCEFDATIPITPNYGEGVECNNNTWIQMSQFHKPLSKVRVYLYSVYHVIVMITTSGMRGFQPANDFDAAFGIVTEFLGYFLFALNAAVIIASLHGSDKKSRDFRSKMLNLAKFMHQGNLKLSARHKINNYFKIYWSEYRCVNVCALYANLPNMLRQDVLMESFGQVFTQSSVFNDAPDAFARLILMNCQSHFYIDHGIVVQLNDVCTKLYLVAMGTVDVYGPANTFFATLQYGSIFGNLDNTPAMRQTITVRAQGYCLILGITATKFHQILGNYPKFHECYLRQTQLHFDFIPNLVSRATYLQPKDETDDPSPKKWKKKKKERKHHTLFRGFNPHSIFMKIWQTYFIFGICLLFYFYELYNISNCNISVDYYIPSYVADGMFLLHMWISSKTAYQNKYGVLTYEKTGKHYRQQFAFVLDVVIALPFEILAYFVQNQKSTFVICRMNKLLRLSYFIGWSSHLGDRLTENLQLFYIFFILMFTVLVLHGLDCLIMGFVCNGNHILHTSPPPVGLQGTYWESYMYHMQTLISVFYSASVDGNYYPVASHMIILFCCMLVIFRVSMAVYIAEISTGVEIAYSFKNEYQRNVIGINHFLDLSQVSKPLINRVMHYLQTVWAIHRHTHFPQLLALAPYYRKEQVLNDLFGKHFTNQEVFQSCHPDFMRQVVATVKLQTYYPGDNIIVEGDWDDAMFCIHVGSVEKIKVGWDHERRVEVMRKRGTMFCIEHGLHDEGPYYFTYRAVATSTIVSLHYADWKFLMAYFPASVIYIEAYLIKIQRERAKREEEDRQQEKERKKIKQEVKEQLQKEEREKEQQEKERKERQQKEREEYEKEEEKKRQQEQELQDLLLQEEVEDQQAEEEQPVKEKKRQKRKQKKENDEKEQRQEPNEIKIRQESIAQKELVEEKTRQTQKRKQKKVKQKEQNELQDETEQQDDIEQQQEIDEIELIKQKQKPKKGKRGKEQNEQNESKEEQQETEQIEDTEQKSKQKRDKRQNKQREQTDDKEQQEEIDQKEEIEQEEVIEQNVELNEKRKTKIDTQQEVEQQEEIGQEEIEQEELIEQNVELQQKRKKKKGKQQEIDQKEEMEQEEALEENVELQQKRKKKKDKQQEIGQKGEMEKVKVIEQNVKLKEKRKKKKDKQQDTEQKKEMGQEKVIEQNVELKGQRRKKTDKQEIEQKEEMEQEEVIEQNVELKERRKKKKDKQQEEQNDLDEGKGWQKEIEQKVEMEVEEVIYSNRYKRANNRSIEEIVELKEKRKKKKDKQQAELNDDKEQQEETELNVAIEQIEEKDPESSKKKRKS